MRSLIWLSVRVLVTLTLVSGSGVAAAPGDACTALDPNAAILSSGFGLNPSNTRNGVSSITASNIDRLRLLDDDPDQPRQWRYGPASLVVAPAGR